MDITKCPLEAFSFINTLAGDHRVSVILLHIINLNFMVLESRVIQELSYSTEQHLTQLAQRFLKPDLSVRQLVRVGKPAQEILAEASESNVDLIVLTRYGGCSSWKRPFKPRIVEKVFRDAPCSTTLLRVRTRFNCEEDWDFVDDIISALNYTGDQRPDPFRQRQPQSVVRRHFPYRDARRGGRANGKPLIPAIRTLRDTLDAKSGLFSRR